MRFSETNQDMQNGVNVIAGTKRNKKQTYDVTSPSTSQATHATEREVSTERLGYNQQVGSPNPVSEPTGRTGSCLYIGMYSINPDRAYLYKPT